VKKAVILGGGVGGLAAGWMLARTKRYDVTVIERGAALGGVCGTFQHGDFLLDYGPHKSYSTIPGILDELTSLMGDEFIKHRKSNTIYLFGSFLRYPISLLDLARKMRPSEFLACGLNAAAAALPLPRPEPRSYEDYVVSRFGRRLYSLVFEPLADKVWGDPATLSADIARTRIPGSGVVDLAMRVLGLKNESALTDAGHFYYPRLGFGRIPGRMHEEILRAGGTVITGGRPARIHTRDQRVIGVDVEIDGRTERLDCDLLVSSIPLQETVAALGGADDPGIAAALAAARQLQFRGAFLVYVVVDRPQVTNHHWLFFPERDVMFGRVFEQKQMSDAMGPPDQTVLCCDFTDDEGGPLWRQSDEALAARCVADLEKVGLIDRAWVKSTFVKRLPKFYPRYDLHYKQTTSILYDFLKRYDGLVPTGRIGFYNYNNSDHCVDMGKYIAQQLEAGIATADIWSGLEQRVAAYRIVD
jgi:protoporphyrinogen oxidase